MATKTIKTAKKPQAKKVASKATTKSVSVPEKKEEVSSSKSQTTQPVKIKKIYIIGVLLILAIGALLYAGRGLFVAAVVNGQPISRLTLVNEIEKQNGRQVLDAMVQQSLIEQEAQKQNIAVTDEEVADEIKKIETSLKTQGQSIDQALQAQNMTRDDLNRVIKVDKLIGKLVGKDITVTDKEIDEYLEKNKALLPQGQKEEDLRKSVAESLKQQKLGEKAQSWLADLKKKANVLYFVNY